MIAEHTWEQSVPAGPWRTLFRFSARSHRAAVASGTIAISGALEHAHPSAYYSVSTFELHRHASAILNGPQAEG